MTELLTFEINEQTCPELYALQNVLQNPVYHPEGDAFQHTLHVMEAAKYIARRDNLTYQDAQILLVAAMCHDFGKATHTLWNEAKGSYTSPGHDAGGVKPTRAFLARMGFDETLTERIVCLVREHMCHVYLQKGKKPSKRAAYNLLERIKGKTTMEELQRLVEADMGGRPPLSPGVPETFLLLAETCREVIETSAADLPEEAKSLLTGVDLLKIGYKQGPGIAKALRFFRQRQDVGELTTKKEAVTFAKSIFDAGFNPDTL